MFRVGKGQVIGAVLAVLILLFQWRYGLIPPHRGWQAVKSLGWPYLILLAVLMLVSACRAPAILDKESQVAQEQLREAAGRLQEENHSLKQEREGPAAVPPEMVAKVREGWGLLKDYEQKAISLLLEYGDMTGRNARVRLNLLNLGNLFPRIEDKTNFVHRTSQGLSAGELQFGYHGTWTINPHFREALHQEFGSPKQR